MTTRAGRYTLVLEQNRSLRLFTLFILYVGQGLPIGLFWFAIPAWMAAGGASASDVGSVLALTALPWSLKFVNGFIMDRYTWLAMGRRRIWLIGAQVVMVLCLLGAMLLNPAVTDVAMLGAVGFIVNMATTFQDVAVDGLAVDIMEHEERSRGSGMMFGGQAIGIAGASAFTGTIIGEFGAPAAYGVVAVLIAVLSVFVVLVNERAGERRLPWSRGEAHARNLGIQATAWWPIIQATFRSLLRSVSLLWVPVLLVRGVTYGVLTGVTPLIGANDVGWDESSISGLAAAGSLVGGILGLTLGGWLGDRIGAKRSTVIWFCCQILLYGGMLLLAGQWQSPTLFMAFVYSWLALDTLLTVATLPISMSLCDRKVAATQFTIYMATSNLGISVGALLLAQSSLLGGLPGMFAILCLTAMLGLVLMMVVQYQRADDPEQPVAMTPTG